MARCSTIPADATEDLDADGVPRIVDLSVDPFVPRATGPRPRRIDPRAVIEARIDRRQRAFARQQVAMRERLTLVERAAMLIRLEHELQCDQQLDLADLALLDLLDAAVPTRFVQ